MHAKALFILVVLFCGFIARAADVTPAQWLAAQPKPVFKPGHTLLPLTKYGWTLPWELTVESATNWGYALDIGGDGLLGANVTNALLNTNTILYKGVYLATNYPNVFKLGVFTDRWNSNLSDLYWITNGAGKYAAVEDSTLVYLDAPLGGNGNVRASVSPEAPQEDLDRQADAIVQPLHAIAAALGTNKIGVILNGGERGIGVVGQDLLAWVLDQRVTDARGTNYWYWYTSVRKSNELYATYSRLPERQAYVWYHHYEKNRSHIGGYNWPLDWARWGWSSSNLLAATDISATEMYHTGADNYTNMNLGDPATAWSRVSDLLTFFLNQAGWNEARGVSTNYPWVCGGWSAVNTNRFSDIPRYRGLLKCFYTAGAVGQNVGYYELPPYDYPSNSIYHNLRFTNTFPENYPTIFGKNGFSGSFEETTPPHWLLQMEASSRVHAQMSWLEDYIRNGSLLSGNGQSIASPYNVHAMARDQPSYEFTNTVADATARVLARKHNDRNEWLVTAWAATGNARDVTVTIPTLGEITVTAHPEANIYTATAAGGLKLLDATGQHVGRKVGRADKLRVRRD